MSACQWRAGLKPFRQPWLWLGLWLAVVTAVIVLSLTPPPAISVPAHTDKVEHLLAYAALAMGAVQLFRRGWPLLVIGLGLMALGAGLEWAQGAWTINRMADPADALANSCGVVLGLLTARLGWADALLRRDHRRAGNRSG